MIDLHAHTNYSDGSLSVSELLQRAEQRKITKFSITDHDSVDAYSELKNANTRNLFTGKIIPGIELGAILDGNIIEILGYGIDIKKMEILIENYPPQTFDDFFTAKVVEKLAEFGLKVNVKPMHVVKLFQHLGSKYKIFFDKFNPHFSQDPYCLYRDGFTNRTSPLYVSFDGFYKPYDEIIQMIKSCGGKTFLAHPAEYRENSFNVLNKTKQMVDGIECFHPSADKAYRDMLIKFAQDNNLLISGGSDYHGAVKPDIELGVGRGDINIPSELISWLDKVPTV